MSEEASRKRSRQVKTTPPPGATGGKGKRSLSEDASVEDRISALRRNAPILYDSFLHHNLQWASLSVAWGGEAADTNRLLLNESTYPEEHNTEQTIYFAGRTDGSLD